MCFPIWPLVFMIETQHVPEFMHCDAPAATVPAAGVGAHVHPAGLVGGVAVGAVAPVTAFVGDC